MRKGSWHKGVFRPYVPIDPDATLVSEQPYVFYPSTQFGDPDGFGYDSHIWPFDRDRAILHDGYRAGVYSALQSRWAAQNWKYYAQKLLDDVWWWRRTAAKYHNTTGRQRGYNFTQSLHVVMGRIPPE